MDASTARRLIDINEQFYQTFGEEFAATRRRLQPGVKRVLDGLAGDESMLDLGCGGGELARELARRAHRGAYLGLDFSPPLLGSARPTRADLPHTFLQQDLSDPAWDEAVRRLSAPPFDLVTAFAVLHHLPGHDLRLATLQKVRQLLQPAGRFIHSEWQFLNSARWRARIQPWAQAGIQAARLEPGDYLLDWRRGGHGLRYVHHFNETELLSLAGAAGFRVCETFHSDGENGRLGLYQVWEVAP